MNTALIFAGGTGQRMNSRTKPKQFLEVHGKPIIVYTMEQFQQHPEIDAIVVVCLESWIPYCKDLIFCYQLNKVLAVVPGGDSGQSSIYQGLLQLQATVPEDSIVLIHDGVRPLIQGETISACIQCVKEHGSAITTAPAIETITVGSSDGRVGEIVDRSRCQMAKAPQCFYLRDIIKAHNCARMEGRNDFIDSASIMRYYGYDLYSVVGGQENIKITTPNDYYMFRAILEARESSQILGF